MNKYIYLKYHSSHYVERETTVRRKIQGYFYTSFNDSDNGNGKVWMGFLNAIPT